MLSPQRRAALIDWAERGDRLIIEDDYDAELCRERVGALQGLAPDRVLYIGSASKRLTPGMRLGLDLPPSWLSWALITAKAIEDGGSEITGQLALADFIARGELDRHLRRMRLRYARRRQTLLAALARELPHWRPHGTGGGLYTLVELPAGVDEPAAARRRRPPRRRHRGALAAQLHRRLPARPGARPRAHGRSGASSAACDCSATPSARRPPDQAHSVPGSAASTACSPSSEGPSDAAGVELSDA